MFAGFVVDFLSRKYANFWGLSKTDTSSYLSNYAFKEHVVANDFT